MAQMRIFQAEIVGNNVEIIFELNMRTFCLSVAPMRKNASPSHLYFTQTCNALVQLVLQTNGGNWHLSRGQTQIHDTLANIPKPELLALCCTSLRPGRLQLYLSREPRRCELRQDDLSGEPVLRLTKTSRVLPDPERQALGGEDRHFASMYASDAGMGCVSANEVSVTSTTSISPARICGDVYRTDAAGGAAAVTYHCIAARDAGVRGARRWACPQRRQLVARQALQAACAAEPDDDDGGGCIRVPALLAYLYDDDDEEEEEDGEVRRSRVMGGLYRRIEGGVPLRVFLAAAAGRGEPKMGAVSAVATEVAGMVAGLHRREFVWGGESEEMEGDAERRTLMDCLVVDRQGHAWLVDGFGAGYHQEALQSDDRAVMALLSQMKLYFPEDEEGG
ncbi:hypothetical protein ISF_02837 [Cordyceps fumosorosea ARSEF 2679]|uniref:Uncharacterized protein n=1 Tax=Cordyceps fumosorosea (strain ARSEF 2679) TaxID=1081104 RepID=A0A168B3E5_CORFA|nr:hypothetical protein ISF_02837 [Cordyceps fumosorosea ARSEF 2679]OAA69567.1 hypothetical protein ISF_02837 [Cordyceps fumosorosea ARSEF 2679]